MSKTPTTLIIMDGFGVWDERAGNAIAAARTPNLDKIFAENPGCRLSASGLDVGLPEGQMGNSEVGHTNIGAGRVVFQDLPRISRAIEDGSFFENEAYIEAMDDCKERDGALHLMGLLSDGGVHSHITHLFALLEMAKKRGLGRVYLENLRIREGADVDPFESGTILLLDRSNMTRTHIDAYFAEHGIEPKQILEATTMDLLIEFAKTGLGIGCVIREFVREELKDGSLIELPLEVPIRNRTIGFAYHPTAMTRTMNDFVQFCSE